jgi:hypothetical protein
MQPFHRLFLLTFTVALAACSYTYTYEPEKQDGFYIDSFASSGSPKFYRLSNRGLIFQIAADQARGSVSLYALQNGEVPPNVLIDEICPADAAGNCQRVRQTNTSLEVICSTAKLVHDGKTYEAIEASPPTQSNKQEAIRIEECSSKANFDGKQRTSVIIRFETRTALDNKFSIILPDIGGSEVVALGTKKVSERRINFSLH